MTCNVRKMLIRTLKLICLVILLSLTVLSPMRIQNIYAIDGDTLPDDPTFPDDQDPNRLDPTVKARVVFTNAPSHQPDLYVSKTVKTESTDTVIPDESFSFQVLIDGSAYAKKDYSVIDISGSPIKDKDGVPVTGKTTAQGTFSLKADQIARFEYVGAGKHYVIKELMVPENFQCTTPASKEASGDLPKDGQQINFVNTYYPPSDTLNVDGKIKISKSIVMPDGFIFADNEEPVFEFKVIVDNKPLSNAKFNLHNIERDHDTLNAGSTNSQGVFTMQAGNIATFENLEANLDYKIIENVSGIWRLVGSSNEEGTTSSDIPASFTNTMSSFAVKKTLTSGTSDESFTFTLFGSGKTILPNAEYWLYKTDGSRIVESYDEEGNAVYNTYKTDENTGKFELKQNQIALFIGLPEGTVYSVQEEPLDHFKQVFPVSSLGYENKTVSLEGSEILLFTNEPKEEKASLSVTKKLDYPEDAPLVNKSFKFVLEDIDGPVKNAIYTIGSDTTNYETNDYGEFFLKQNETATFDRLMIGDYYRVREILNEKEYLGYKLYTDDLYYDDVEDIYYLGDTLDDEDSLSFVFTNIYTPKKTSLIVNKVKSSDDDTVLENAKFALFLDENCETFYSDDFYFTNEEGFIKIDNLKSGVYYLKEIAPPNNNYKVLPAPVKVIIERLKNSYNEEGFKLSLEYDDSIMGKVSIVTNQSYSENPVLEFTVKDDDARIIVLPSTGGPGVYIYLLAGAALLTYGLLEKKR